MRDSRVVERAASAFVREVTFLSQAADRATAKHNAGAVRWGRVYMYGTQCGFHRSEGPSLSFLFDTMASQTEFRSGFLLSRGAALWRGAVSIRTTDPTASPFCRVTRCQRTQTQSTRNEPEERRRKTLRRLNSASSVSGTVSPPARGACSPHRHSSAWHGIAWP